MSSFVIRKEGFKFKIFDQVPIAGPEQSILLYRSANGSNGSMLIDGTYTPFSSDIRRGKYDTKVIFSMGVQSLQIQDKVLIEGHKCYFIINMSIDYKLQNVREYYFTETDSCEKKIEQSLKECIYSYDNKFDLHRGNDLQRELNKIVNSRLQHFSYLSIISVKVEVTPDDEAVKLIKSDVEKERVIHISQNDSDKKIIENRQQIRVQQSVRELHQAKSEGFVNLVQQYGELAPIMQEYFDGKIDGQQLDQRIREKKREDMQYMAEGWKNDMLSEEFIEQEYTKKIAGGSFYQSQTVEIEKKDDTLSDKTRKYIDVQEIGDEDYL